MSRVYINRRPFVPKRKRPPVPAQMRKKYPKKTNKPAEEENQPTRGPQAGQEDSNTSGLTVSPEQLEIELEEKAARLAKKKIFRPAFNIVPYALPRQKFLAVAHARGEQAFTLVRYSHSDHFAISPSTALQALMAENPRISQALRQIAEVLKQFPCRPEKKPTLSGEEIFESILNLSSLEETRKVVMFITEDPKLIEDMMKGFERIRKERRALMEKREIPQSKADSGENLPNRPSENLPSAAQPLSSENPSEDGAHKGSTTIVRALGI